MNRYFVIFDEKVVITVKARSAMFQMFCIQTKVIWQHCGLPISAIFGDGPDEDGMQDIWYKTQKLEGGLGN